MRHQAPVLRRRALFALVAGLTIIVAGCAAPPAPAPAPAPGTVLWSGDAETGDLSQFQHAPWNDVGGVAPHVTTDPVRSGRFAIALSLRGTTTPVDGICCGSRNELLPRFRDLVPGDDLFFGFSTYLGPGFPTATGWQVLTQFKQNFDGSPPLSLNVADGQFEIEGGFGHPAGPRLFDKPVGTARTGVWDDWVLHVKFSADPTVGFIEAWRNGELVLARFQPPGGTMYPQPTGPGSYLKIGYYRDQTISVPATLYIDDWRIGTTRDVVAPGSPPTSE